MVYYFFFISRKTSTPFNFGICTSIRTKSKDSVLHLFKAISPSCAISVSKPSSIKTSAIVDLIAGWSSTMRILLFWSYSLCVIYFKGNSIMIFVPRFTLLKALMFPPCLEIRSLHRDRPNPIPSFFICEQRIKYIL